VDSLLKDFVKNAPLPTIEWGNNQVYQLTSGDMELCKELDTGCRRLWKGDKESHYSVCALLQHGRRRGIGDGVVDVALAALSYWVDEFQMHWKDGSFNFGEWLEGGWKVMLAEGEEVTEYLKGLCEDKLSAVKIQITGQLEIALQTDAIPELSAKLEEAIELLEVVLKRLKTIKIAIHCVLKVLDALLLLSPTSSALGSHLKMKCLLEKFEREQDSLVQKLGNFPQEGKGNEECKGPTDPTLLMESTDTASLGVEEV